MTNLQKTNENEGSNKQFVYKPSLRSMEALAEHGKTLKPLRKLFGNYILENSLTHFPSERGTGKTFLGLEICLAISSKWDNFCGEEITLFGNTLFVNCELNEDLVSRRLAKLFDDPPYPIKQEEFKAYTYTTRNSFGDEVLYISQFISEYDPVLIVLDNYRMAFADSEKTKEIINVMKKILELKDTYNTSILLTDHTRKHTRNLMTESDLQSGSGAKSDLVDSDMFLRKSSQNKNYRILKRDKSRNTEESQNAKLLTLNTESLWFECLRENVNEEEHLGNGVISDDEEKKDIARELKEKGKSYGKIAQLLNVSKSKVYRWFNN